ncbi:unnamed protein product, partial [Musa banksii]
PDRPPLPRPADWCLLLTFPFSQCLCSCFIGSIFIYSTKICMDVLVKLPMVVSLGAGFASQGLYLHGFFSASIKLPADYAAGVVVAFYMSNGDVFEKTHDELDFEFLGNIRGR